MNDFHVVMPIDRLITVDSRFDTLFERLDAQFATVHFVSSVERVPAVYDDSAAMHAQQNQVRKMGLMLRYEMLDRLAQAFQNRYPGVHFEYHVDIEPVHKQVSRLSDHLPLQLLIVDQAMIVMDEDTEQVNAIQQLVSVTHLPIWSVGPSLNNSGDVMVAMDIPTHNHQHDVLNRSMIQIANQLVDTEKQDIQLAHSWQLTGEQFMRQWLQLTDIDVARFSRVEKQQRETRLLEYVDEAKAKNATFRIRVLEGAPEVTIRNVCQQSVSLLIIGHNQNPYGPLGHVTANTLTSVECDTLVIPPVSMIKHLRLPVFHRQVVEARQTS